MEAKWAEHRKYPRKQVCLWVEVRLDSGVIVDGAALNLSHGGLLFETDFMLPLDCTVRVTLLRDGEAREHHVECHGTVCRLDSQGVAIMFGEVCADCTARLNHLLQTGEDDGGEPILVAAFAGEYY